MSNNYASSLIKEKSKNEENKKEYNTKELLNKGWTILNKNKVTNTITITRPYNDKFLKSELEKKKIKLGLNKMVENWNNFRDNDIKLNGDLSVYYNYKKELEKLVLEDQSLEEMLTTDNNSEHSDNDYSDDDLYKF